MSHALIDLDQILSANTMQRLQEEATRTKVDVAEIVRDALETYLDDEEELEDTPDEKILADFRQGWHEAMTGKTVPADVALKRLREKLANERN